MKNKARIALLLSLILHASLVCYLVKHTGEGTGDCQGPNCTNEDQKGQKGKGDGKDGDNKEKKEGDQAGGGRFKSNGADDILPKPVEMMKVTPEVQAEIDKQDNKMKLEEKKKKELAERKKKEQKDCPYFFGGIGVILHEEYNVDIQQYIGIVLRVVEGYPADQAGIMEGDYILDDVTGPVGEVVNFRIMHNGELRELSLVREKICTSRPPRSP
jgi:hypothetical protein